MKNLFVLLGLFFIGSIDVVSAGQTIYLSPTNEDGINDALETAKGASGTTTVILNPGVYEIRGSVIIYSNTVLKGNNAKLLIPSDSKQWFVPPNGIITNKRPVENVTIEDLIIDGNCHNLPAKYADTPGHKHDCEKLIVIKGYSNKFSKNIVVKNCKFANAFSDAVYMRFVENAIIENNQISNCQHSSVYLSRCVNGLILYNDIAGITSDDVRVESSKNVKVLYNNLYGYFGSKSNGAYQGGHNLVQVGDQGRSHGYGSTIANDIHTENIEIAYNTFSGKHRNTIWIDAAGKTPTTNLWIHDNKFVDMPEIERDGYSAENPPSIEETEEIFTTLKDLLKRDYTFQYLNIEQDLEASAEVVYHNYSTAPYSLLTVEGEDDIEVIKISYDGNSARHFVGRDMWVGEFQRVGDGWYIPGEFDADKLKVTVYSKKGFKTLSKEEIEVENAVIGKAGINPDLFTFISVLTISGISIIRSIRRIL
jgi:hypothetical protein